MVQSKSGQSRISTPQPANCLVRIAGGHSTVHSADGRTLGDLLPDDVRQRLEKGDWVAWNLFRPLSKEVGYVPKPLEVITVGPWTDCPYGLEGVLEVNVAGERLSRSEYENLRTAARSRGINMWDMRVYHLLGEVSRQA